VVADPAKLRLFVDESLMGLGKALYFARKDVVYAGHALIPDAPTGALDTAWIPAVAARGLAVITRDRHVRTRTAERERLLDHGLRVFCIAGKRDLDSWGYLLRMVRRWADLERTLEEHGPGPWYMAIHESRISEVIV
jgi:hypothetical protein